MSIKWKTTILFIGSFCLNIILLLLFFYYNFGSNLDRTIMESREKFIEQTQDITNELKGLSYSEAIRVLDSYEEEYLDRYYALEKIGPMEYFEFPNQIGGFGFQENKMIVLDGESYILLISESKTTLNNGNRVSITEMLRSLLIFECIILFFIFILQRYVFNKIMIMPLTRMKENVDNLKRGEFTFESSTSKDEIGELENSFQIMAATLKEEKETQSRMIASISHDVKTPLTVIMGSSERLLKSNLDEERRNAYLKTIYSQSRNIDQIVQDFDELLEQSLENKMDLKEIKVNYICQMIQDEYLEYLNDNGVLLTIKNECSNDLTIIIDIAKIRRIFMNIISNTLKHNQLDNLRIDIRIYQNKDRLCFEVMDNGKGVESADLEHLFEPFYTSDKSRQLSGLGLSICKLFVEKHQGIIKATNKEKGFKVYFELPLIKQ